MSDETTNIITLIDGEGDEIEFELLDEIEHKGSTYAVLLPLDDETDDTEYVILLEKQNEDNEIELVGINDAALLDEVFSVFKRRLITSIMDD